MIVGTVALPIWNSPKIVWLCLESLCRQKKPVDGWELIVYEEKHQTQVGEEYIMGYEPRLRDVGCKRIVYLTSDVKVPLSQKWVTMAKAASDTSKYFWLCGADDYYHSELLVESEQAIKEADWCLTTKGYFYDFHRDKVIHYNLNTLTGLHMTARTEFARMLPMDEVNQGVDGWFSRTMIAIIKAVRSGEKNGQTIPGQVKAYMSCSDEWEHILCTNGLNNISKQRYKFFDDVHPPFYKTDKQLKDIVPEDIYIRLMAIPKS